MVTPKDNLPQMQAQTSFDPHFGANKQSFDDRIWEWGEELTRTGELGRLKETDTQSKAA
jgi:hypothetical protein